MKVSYIPAGVDFLRTLAQHIKDDSAATQTELTRYHILLPTRRAVRTLQGMFMTGTAVMLPRIDAIGDLDEDILTLQMPDIEMPPVIAPAARLGLFIRLIQERAEMPWPRALAMAEALIKLLDESILREVPLNQLAQIVEGEVAQHWQMSLEWLQVIMHRWPEILCARGEIDAAAARQNLLNHYSELWQKHPPPYPVIAAGSTGSLPATRRILKTIAALPRGNVILPALDNRLPDEIWDELPLSHPQRNMKTLLDEFGIARSSVKSLCDHECPHGVLWQQVLFPAAATDRWRDPNFRLIQSSETNSKYLQNLHCLTAANGEEEAQAIALIMQRAVSEGKTAALVTPDRNLAQRTSARLARVNIQVNDTAGQTLMQSPAGRWMRLLLQAFTLECDAISSLAILKHPLSCFGTTRAACRTAARQMEREYFRAETPAQNLSALLAVEMDLPLQDALKILCIEFTPRSLRDWCALLIELGEKLTVEPDSLPLLWRGDAGEALYKMLAELADQSDYFPVLDTESAMELFTQQMQSIAVRPPDAHPDLQILGAIEARLHHFDIVILGGLNEGIWPQAAAADPWLSRPMRAEMQLALPDDKIALTAHDFYQLAVQAKVYLTRAAFADGAPALPSRWWQRLIAYLEACQLDKNILEAIELRAAAGELHAAEMICPAPQPRPTPPAAVRPARFSPSAVETLMRNPYEFYAKYILRLRALPDIGAEAAEKEEGNLLHQILMEFTETYPSTLPGDAEQILNARARELLAALNLPAAMTDFWWQNWLRARNNFITWQEAAVRAGRRVVAREHPLAAAWQNITLQARADRIDVDAEGNFIIVDYKRKNAPTKNEAVNFRHPQLLIEGWLLAACGIAGHPPRNVAGAEFWPLLEHNIITPDAEKFTDAIARLPDELGAYLQNYLRAETEFAATVPNNPFADQAAYVQLSRAGEWQGRAA